MVKDIGPGPSSGVGGWLANSNGTLLFFANDGTGIGLWKSDGTYAGTSQINGLVGASGSPAVVNGALYFSAIDPRDCFKTAVKPYG
jgi:ELWxxDGT repeat protein